MVRELDEYMRAQEKAIGKGSIATSKMKSFMDDYFEQLKQDVGINRNVGFEEDEPKLEDVMAQIKANTNPKNFREFWKKSDNINKSLKNRAISRKLHEKEERELYR